MIRPPPSQPRPFEADLESALAALQSSLTAACEALPENPRRAPDLARQLKLERNLAWKLFRVMNERDLFAAARFVPGPASIDTFIAAAKGAGIPQPLLDAVQASAATYAEVVRVHAGDRVSADIMLSVKGNEAGELALRRAAFRSTSYLTGVQAQTQLQVFMIAPSAVGNDKVDGLAIKGFVDLSRVRPDAPVIIGKSLATDDRGSMIRPVADEAIDPLPAGENVPLLREFCSSPLPRFIRSPAESGFVEDSLEPGPVGKTGAITFMTANVIRGMAYRYRTPLNETVGMVCRVRTPAAVLICDVLVHQALFGDSLANDATARVMTYNDLYGDAMRREPDHRDRFRLGPMDRIAPLGRGIQSAHSPDIPRYTTMLKHIMDKLSWDASQFMIFRVRVEFPFTPTSVVLSFDMLDPPTPK